MVTARDWSDTATFLLEAEVFHPMVSQIVHESYPVIFGDGLNFTLPASAEGVSLEADFDGQTVIFPLGPSILLSWEIATPGQIRIKRESIAANSSPDTSFSNHKAFLAMSRNALFAGSARERLP